MNALASDITVSTPAFPDNGRTVFKGDLFIGDVLLSNCGMCDHPLTPMTDANLVRVLQAQSRNRVGWTQSRTVKTGAEAISERIRAFRSEGIGVAIVDAISNAELLKLGLTLRNFALKSGNFGSDEF